MSKRSKRRKANGKYNGLDPDEQLTPRQACAYAAERDVHLNTNILTLLRRDGKGPRYWKIGHWVKYTPRTLNPYIETRRPRLINPAERRRK